MSETADDRARREMIEEATAAPVSAEMLIAGTEAFRAAAAEPLEDALVEAYAAMERVRRGQA